MVTNLVLVTNHNQPTNVRIVSREVDMLKLYYAPGACSMSPHIALREAGVPFELVRVDFMRGRKTADGRTLPEVNPKGYVPALILDNGELLTEGAVILQYIADLKPEAGIAPPQGTFERVRLQEWLNFIATELHKALSPFYAATTNEEYKTTLRERLAGRMAFLAKSLEGKQFLLGDRFTVADAYAFYALRAWDKMVKTELPEVVQAYRARIAARPAVKAVLEAEGQT
jgi:glutathione S-transferase